ncbi:MAG: indole-3-glycerol-phosphate synthase [Desulfovibrio sp.]|jgi:indole-3-glycerol phosphate synthase|nr:indole-3-glycerol-phosphate synthase [Desulfovibrio sp.]
MLERFRIAKAAELAALEDLAARGAMPPPRAGGRPPFRASLQDKARPVIAEYKRASPSKGDINLGWTPEDVAAAYAEAGAGALSVLTEETYFKGSPDYLQRMAGPGLPLLRKDFIIHPLQVEQTAATPASALLLIARMLDADMLRLLIRTALNFGLEPVTEIFDLADLDMARKAGATIIQVNNRDLSRLAVDLCVSRTLIVHKAPGEFWISASGIEDRAGLDGLLGLGFDAGLVGSSLMAGQDPGQALAALLGKREGNTPSLRRKISGLPGVLPADRLGRGEDA